MPVLAVGGRRLFGSPAIIGALAKRVPPRALYPTDRSRALELEDWFDENVGPYARQWGFNALLTEPEAVRAFAIKQTEWAPLPVPPVAFAPIAKAFLAVRYSVANEAGVREARRKLVHGLDRLEAELDGQFLVGGRFSIADLTAAALFFPPVLPGGGPWGPVRAGGFLGFQGRGGRPPGFRWVEETFRRHRHDTGV